MVTTAKKQAAGRPASGFGVASVGTLVSRLLGLARDVATAALLGMSAALDAFVLAFRLPDLFRRFFGEGILTASYVPVLSARRMSSQQAAWKLAATAMVALAGLVTALVLLGELALWIAYRRFGVPSDPLTAELSALLLPYLILICLTAQLASTLHTSSHFMAPAMAPILINVVWLIAVLVVAPTAAPGNQDSQTRILAGAVLLGGALQFGSQLWVLRRLGFRFHIAFRECGGDLLRIGGLLLPAMIGLAAPQLNTLADSFFAWFLSPAAGTEASPGMLQPGAVAATYFGERMYMFPLGIIGVAVATVSYPRLAELARARDWASLREKLTWGMQINSLLSIPATAGLLVLAEPITRVLFERGEFGPESTVRVAAVVAGYAWGVWAFCCLPLVVRAFYANGQFRRPLLAGLIGVLTNAGLNSALVGKWQESGLATATAISAFAQLGLLLAFLQPLPFRPNWRPLVGTIAASLLATGIMTAAILFGGEIVTGALGETVWALLATICIGIAAYLLASSLLQPHLLRELLGRVRSKSRNGT